MARQLPGAPTATAQNSDDAAQLERATDNVGVTEYRVHRSTTAGFTPSAANRMATVSAAPPTPTPAAGDRDLPLPRGRGRRGRQREPGVDRGQRRRGRRHHAPTVSLTAPAAGATLSGHGVASPPTPPTTWRDRACSSGWTAPTWARRTPRALLRRWNTTTAVERHPHADGVARDAAGNTEHRDERDGHGRTTPSNPNGLVAAYGFEEASGANTVDELGHRQHGHDLGGDAHRHGQVRQRALASTE